MLILIQNSGIKRLEETGIILMHDYEITVSGMHLLSFIQLFWCKQFTIQYSYSSNIIQILHKHFSYCYL